MSGLQWGGRICRIIKCVEAAGHSRAAVPGTGEQSLGRHLRKLLSFSGTAGGCSYCNLAGAKHLQGWRKGSPHSGFFFSGETALLGSGAHPVHRIHLCSQVGAEVGTE